MDLLPPAMCTKLRIGTAAAALLYDMFCRLGASPEAAEVRQRAADLLSHVMKHASSAGAADVSTVCQLSPEKIKILYPAHDCISNRQPL